MYSTAVTAAALAVPLMLAAAVPAGAQQDNVPGFEEGRALFEENCAPCHQSSGEGLPPNFPALAGNERLSDPALIVSRVRAGFKAMPAFPDLGAAEIAALATYVRNAWGNSFEAVTTEEVEKILPTVEETEASRTIWDGVYTERQAEDARLLYIGGCAPCHGTRLNGAPAEADMSPAPPLAGTTFLREWDGRSLAALYEFTRTTMPIRNPGQFSDQQYAGIIAYMLHYEGIPAGSEPLPPDIGVLQDIIIERAPAQD